MEQIQQFDQKQDQVLDQEIGQWTGKYKFVVSSETTIGAIFSDFLLKERKDLSKFDKHAKSAIISIDAVMVPAIGRVGHARISEILRMTVKPTQVVGILPAVAGG